MNAHQSMVANNSIVLVNALGGAPIANKVLRTGCNFVPVTRLAFSQVIILAANIYIIKCLN